MTCRRQSPGVAPLCLSTLATGINGRKHRMFSGVTSTEGEIGMVIAGVIGDVRNVITIPITSLLPFRNRTSGKTVRDDGWKTRLPGGFLGSLKLPSSRELSPPSKRHIGPEIWHRKSVASACDIDLIRLACGLPARAFRCLSAMQNRLGFKKVEHRQRSRMHAPTHWLPQQTGNCWPTYRRRLRCQWHG